MSKIGILLTNTGTPDAPTTSAVRTYLREFLSDPRIVQLPRIVWLPILYGLILTLRPKKSALLYQKIWTPAGSPMRVLMHSIQKQLQLRLGEDYIVELGMNYGTPAIKQGLQKLKAANVSRVIVLPLFPQYSDTSTGSTYDRVNASLRKWHDHPETHTIHDYAGDPDYIYALSAQIETHWMAHGKSDHLLISFHGIPERLVRAGDPYQTQCEQTATLLANALKLKSDQWTLCYQSQFGYDNWLKPSIQSLFDDLPKKKIKCLDVICPGFAVDCLETLEEIKITGKESFQKAGGEELRYIDALNDSSQQIELLYHLVKNEFSESM